MNEALFLEVIFVIFTENLSAMLSDIQGPPGIALRSHCRVHDSTTWVLLPANGEASFYFHAQSPVLSGGTVQPQGERYGKLK